MMMKQSMFLAGMLLIATAASAQQAPATQPARGAMGAGGHAVDPAISAFLKPVDAAPGDNELRQKMKEHHNTAVKVLQWRIDQYRNGVGEIGLVFAAAKDVAETNLALAQSDSERVAVLEQIVGVTKTVEGNLEKQWKAGLGSEGVYLRAKLARESAEIDLLKAKSAGPTTRP